MPLVNLLSLRCLCVCVCACVRARVLACLGAFECLSLGVTIPHQCTASAAAGSSLHLPFTSIRPLKTPSPPTCLPPPPLPSPPTSQLRTLSLLMEFSAHLFSAWTGLACPGGERAKALPANNGGVAVRALSGHGV